MQKITAMAFAVLAGCANAQTFQGRDLNGDGTADAYFHVEQNITWMGDANYYATLGGAPDEPYWSNPSQPAYLPAGQLRLPTALSFVESLSIAGVDGWRLPARLVPAGDPTGSNPFCSATACAPDRLWPSELSVMLSSTTGTGPFTNVMNGDWGYLTFSQGVNYAQLLNPVTGWTFGTDETSLVWGYVWAVHDGDIANVSATVTPVPEPSTYALMFAGLLGLAAFARKQNGTRA